MGLSSSQARLLSLTGRMHDIEYKAQHLEAQKLQMANESAHVYKEYENALNKTKIQVKQLASDGSTTYIDATYNSMKSLGYTMKFQDDYKPIISLATESNLKVAGNNRDYFIALESGRVTSTNTKVNGVTEIYTADQLKNMSSSGNYRLMSDIDMTGINWTSKSFSGNLDGNGHTIRGLNKALFSTMSGTVSNLNINGDVTTGKGILANVINSGTVENVTVSGSINSTLWNVGALAGEVCGSSIVNNCSSSATVVSTGGQVGGLIGIAEGSSKIDNCSASGNVTGKSAVGGFIGYVNSANVTVTNSLASGDVYATLNETGQWGGTCSSGGFVGISTGTIKSCEARGNVTSESEIVGGFIGHAAGKTCLVENSNAYGNVIGNASGNMLTGNDKSRISVAGFASAVNGGTIKNCNAFGTTSSGNPTQATTTFASGNVSGFDNIGKIINGYAPPNPPQTFSRDNEILTKMEFVSEATTPNNNVITVTPPTVKTTETVNDTTGAGKTFDEINKYGGYIIEGTADDPVGRYGDDSNWFTTMVNEGLLFLFKNDNEGNEYQVNVATDTSLQEVTDDVDLKKAEAKYEADMRKINAKDKKFDTDLASLESERNAINTEMDTLKSVAKDNVDRTFKLFS